MIQYPSYIDGKAEVRLLSLLCKDKKLFFDSSLILSDEDFEIPYCSRLYNVISHVHDKEQINGKFDADYIADIAEKLKIQLSKSDFSNIKNILQLNVPKNLFDQLLGKVKDLSLKRKLVETSTDITGIVCDTQHTSLDMAAKIEGVVQETVVSFDRKDSVEIVGKGFMDIANELADSPCETVGISTGLLKYDSAIGGGLRRGSVNLIAARPKTFKSGTALNIARNITRRNVPVLLIDTELTRNYQMLRLAANISGVSINKIETGAWKTKMHWADLVENAAEEIETLPIYHIYVGGWSLDKILSLARYWLVKYVGRDEATGQFGDCVIIYDYVKLMKSSDIKQITEWQLLGFHMTALHDFSTIHNVPLLVFAQLNREGQVAAADRLSWFASSISRLARKEQEEIALHGIAAGNLKLSIDMTRYGPGIDSDDYICYRVNFPCMQMEEWKLKSEIQPIVQPQPDPED